VSTESEAKVWERQRRESPRAYAAFVVYRDLGPGRSLSEAARSLKRSKTLLAEWSRTHNWVARADEFDAAMDRRANAAAQKRVEADERRWTGVRKQHRDRMLLAAQTLLSRADEMAGWPIAVQQITEKDEDGRPVTVNLVPQKWTFRDMAAFYETADRPVRLAADTSTSNAAISIPELQRIAKRLGTTPEVLEKAAEALRDGKDLDAILQQLGL